jgi:hypothetical protein
MSAPCRWDARRSRQGSRAREFLERVFTDARQLPPAPAVETGDLAVLRALLLESDMLTAISPHQLRYEIREISPRRWRGHHTRYRTLVIKNLGDMQT